MMPEARLPATPMAWAILSTGMASAAAAPAAAAGARRRDIVEPARGNAEAGDIEHQKPDGLARRVRQSGCVNLRGKLRQFTGYRHARLAFCACAARHSLTKDPIMMMAASTKNAM